MPIIEVGQGKGAQKCGRHGTPSTPIPSASVITGVMKLR